MSGRLLAAIVAAFVVVGLGVTAIAQPQPDPSKQCKKGRVTGTGDASADENGNGFVCVNQETGAVSDDKEQFAPDDDSPSVRDLDVYGNSNGFVCYNPETGVATDDDLQEDFTPQCPPGFFFFPAIIFPE